MTKTIIAITLTVAASAAQADAFAPWEIRGVAADSNVTSSAMVEPTGFAPWRDRVVQPDRFDTELRMGEAFGTVFRPWS